MSSSFMVYIDESGDDGFAWDRGGSDWTGSQAHRGMQTMGCTCAGCYYLFPLHR